MKPCFNRRHFLKSTALAGAGLSLPVLPAPVSAQNNRNNRVPAGKRVGIIGLDTSHSIEFTKAFNAPDAGPELGGYKVVAAYPQGSADIESSARRIPGYTEEVKKYNVRIVDSIQALLSEADVVLLETNDGRPRLAQAMQVLKAGKPLFIDKPVAASLRDVAAIYEAAGQLRVPIFSASLLRYIDDVQAVVRGEIGPVTGADAFSPAHFEQSHPDFFWYGIHGVETLLTLMGPGCQRVARTQTDTADVVVGVWHDHRIGTFRGLHTGKLTYGGTAYGEKGVKTIGYRGAYRGLLPEIVTFFQTGRAPVSPAETIEIYAFMEAADESKRQGGKTITLAGVLEKAVSAKK